MPEGKINWKKCMFFITIILSLIGLYLTLRIHGWFFVKTFSMLSTIFPGLVWALKVGAPPQQDATKYVYEKDRSKLFNRGKLLDITAMSGKKSVSEAQNNWEEKINKKGGYKFLFYRYFLRPWLIIQLVAYLIVGWGSYIRFLLLHAKWIS